MPGTFPALRTGAVAQYPLTRELAHATQVVRFLDGSEQTYRDSGTARRRWLIELSLLGDYEIAGLRAFFEEQKGRWGTFTFVDPGTGLPHANCSFEDDVFPEVQQSEGINSVLLTVYEHA
jgi:hypothetical protein